MTQRERQGWIIVASLFVTLVFVFGSGYNTGGLFFPHLLKHFGWSRTQLSTLQGFALPISAGLCAPLIGWLLDRVEARIVMVAGTVMTGVSFLIASRVDSFGPLFGAYVLLGVGIGASTLLPCSLVIANWFGARRGLAMGITFAGTSLGGAAMTMVGNFAIVRGGWRAGYVALAIPMFLVVVPLIIFVVKTRPPQAEGVSVAQASDALPGFELREAFRCRSFWMISAASFFFAAVAAGAGLHLITYLTELGYSPSFAAGTATATRPRPSPKPPEAIIGILTLSAAAGIRIRPGVSSSPGCPAHSNPSIEIASTPMRSADSAWRTLVHLCTTTMPCFLNSVTCSCGLLPAVSTILMPLSIMAWRYSA
jgi:MFS family permease